MNETEAFYALRVVVVLIIVALLAIVVWIVWPALREGFSTLLAERMAARAKTGMSYHLEAFLNRFRPRLSGTITNQAIVLDNRVVEGVTFDRCHLLYGGGKLILRGNRFSYCTFSAFGKASRTIVFLRGLEEAGGDGPSIVRATFPGSFKPPVDERPRGLRIVKPGDEN